MASEVARTITRENGDEIATVFWSDGRVTWDYLLFRDENGVPHKIHPKEDS